MLKLFPACMGLKRGKHPDESGSCTSLDAASEWEETSKERVYSLCLAAWHILRCLVFLSHLWTLGCTCHTRQREEEQLRVTWRSRTEKCCFLLKIASPTAAPPSSSVSHSTPISSPSLTPTSPKCRHAVLVSFCVWKQAASAGCKTAACNYFLNSPQI